MVKMRVMDLPQRLYAWRKKLRLTLQEVAAKSGVTAGAISHGEVGDRDMRLATLAPIVTKGFGISLQQFFGPIPKFKETPGPRRGRPRTVSKPIAGARAA